MTADRDPFASVRRSQALHRAVRAGVAVLVLSAVSLGWSSVAAQSQTSAPQPTGGVAAAVSESAGAAGDGSEIATAQAVETAEPAAVAALAGPSTAAVPAAEEVQPSSETEAVQEPEPGTRVAGAESALAGQASLPAPDPAVEKLVAYIAIDTTGYQAEVDRCLWVRMDLTGTVPIVAAHISCGGEIVLGLEMGDEVFLSGQDLDGKYTVTDSRDAHPGDIAATATAGMTAVVILQTCYWDNGAVRLVGLSPVASW